VGGNKGALIARLEEQDVASGARCAFPSPFVTPPSCRASARPPETTVSVGSAPSLLKRTHASCKSHLKVRRVAMTTTRMKMAAVTTTTIVTKMKTTTMTMTTRARKTQTRWMSKHQHPLPKPGLTNTYCERDERAGDTPRMRRWVPSGGNHPRPESSLNQTLNRTLNRHI